MKLNLNRLIPSTAALAGLLFLGTATTHAALVNLSTGLDASYNNILAGNTPDAHWTVDQPGGGTAPAKVVAPGNPGGAFFAWAANGPQSSWITIDPNSAGNAPVVPYTYYRKFNLSSPSLATASISGTWGIDDGGEVRLNGNLISASPADYSATTPFLVGPSSGFFVAGLNTLTITMTTSDNFLEAVRLEGSLSTPDSGATFLLLNASIAGIFAANRFRSRK